jgi:HEAT repeat protein
MKRMTQRPTAPVMAFLLCALLFSCASPPDVEKSLKDLDDAHWQVRASAADQLGRLKSERAVDRLRSVLTDKSAEVRTAAATALGRIGARAARDDIRARVADEKDSQAAVQALFALAAVAATGGIERQADIDLIVDKLFSDSDRVESAARRALFAVIDRGELVAMIRADLRSRAALVRLRASRMASVLELPELAGWQRDLLGDANADVRSNAFEAILREPHPDDYTALVRGLADTSATVRVESAVGLEDLSDPAALPALSRAAGGDADADVREAAATAAAAIQKIPGSQLPAVWHFERIDDRVALDATGACTLTRTMTVAIEASPEPVRDLRILLPEAFPRIDRVTDAQGNPLQASVEWMNGLRELVFSSPPIESGGSATFTVVARSDRPISSYGADRIELAYSPGPVQARVQSLHVSLLSPAGSVASLDRSALTPADIEDVIVRAEVAASGLRLARPPGATYSRVRDLTAASGVVASVLAILAATIIRLRKTMGERAPRMILVAVLTAGAILLLTPILTEDNLPYYALARSAVLDGDLDRINEYTEFNQTQAFAQDNRDPQDPVLASLIRTPLVAAAHVVASVRNGLSAAHAPNGFTFPYLFITAVGDFFAVLIGCLACFALVERRVGRRYALFSVLAVLFGTNLLLFAYAWTGGSFQPSFLLFAVFLNRWDETREDRSTLDWLVAGVLLGLLGMTRTLNLAFAVIPFIEWCRIAAGRSNAPGAASFWRKHVGDGSLFTLGMLVGFAPQLIVQRLLDQTWLIDAYGVGTGRFGGFRDNAWGLFFSADNGLFSPMPILVLAFIGIVPLFPLRSQAGDRRHRRAGPSALCHRVVRALLGLLRLRHAVPRSGDADLLPRAGEPPSARRVTLARERRLRSLWACDPLRGTQRLVHAAAARRQDDRRVAGSDRDRRRRAHDALPGSEARRRRLALFERVRLPAARARRRRAGARHLTDPRRFRLGVVARASRDPHVPRGSADPGMGRAAPAAPAPACLADRGGFGLAGRPRVGRRARQEHQSRLRLPDQAELRAEA